MDLDTAGRERWVVAVKATYRIGEAGTALQSSAIHRVDRTADDGALAVAADFRPVRVGTDFLVRGTAIAPAGPTRSFSATLEVDGRAAVLHVSGPRVWKREADALTPSEASLISSAPLVTSLAYGGKLDVRNPTGVGSRGGESDDLEGCALPQIEWADQLVTTPESRPSPALLGGIAASWEPRREHAGTYDDGWVRSRAPLPADDRDDRFFRAATERLAFARPLRGGEIISLENLGRPGRRTLAIPRIAPRLLFEGSWTTPLLDLVVLDVDADEISLTFGAAIDIADRLDERLVLHVTERTLIQHAERALT